MGYYYGGEDVPAHTFEWKLPKGEVWFYAVANEQEAGELLSENKGDIFVLPGETAGGVRPVEGLEVAPDRLESLTFSRLPEAEYMSGGTETDKDETGKKYRSAIVPTVSYTHLDVYKRQGVPYWYMYKKHFPELRASRLYLWYEKVWNPIAPMPMPSIELPVPEPEPAGDVYKRQPLH